MQLDPNDPTDRKIIARQVRVARQAGRDGLDRAAATRGRADLESAYDEGTLQASAPVSDGGGQGSPAPGGKRGKGGGKSPDGSPSTPSARKASGPGWKAFKPTSPAKPPTRVADAGGFLSGLALYAVVVIYIRYGAEGWKGWLKAKFLNQPMTSKTDGSVAGKPKTKKGGSKFV